MNPVLKILSLKEVERPNDSTQLPFAEYGMSKIKKTYRRVCCKQLQCQIICNLFFLKNTHVTVTLIKLFMKTYEQFEGICYQ